MSEEELVLVIPRTIVMDDPGSIGIMAHGADACEDLVGRHGVRLPGQ